MIGFAQMLMLKTNNRATKFSNIPTLNDVRSLINPISNCITAPPIIPVINIPAKEPWCLLTEFKASDKIIGYITDRKIPQI